MKISRKNSGLSWIVLLLAFFLVIWPHSAWAIEKLPIFVSILPQKYFVQKIGGELVDVSVLVEPGAGPETYEPKPRQMVTLSKAKIYFAIGVPFEKKWLPKIVSLNPTMMLVHTDTGIAKIPMKAHQHPVKKALYYDLEETVGHTELKAHEAGNQAHQGMADPHIWLSPSLVKIQARHISVALAQVDPGHKIIFRSNLENFLEELDKMDTELRDMFADKKDREFFVFHPSWGYFAQAYGLKQTSIETEGKDPKPAQLKEIIAHAKAKDIKVIFVQPHFSTKSAELIAKAIGAKVVQADPLAGDWAANLRHQARKFNAALE